MRQMTYVLAAVVALGLGTTAFGGIEDTAHDLSDLTTNGRICLPCHVPHNAMTETDGSSMILWNHTLSSQTFIMYSPFATDRGDRDQDGEPGTPSKLCLSCHDGSIAVDSYGGAAGDPATKITGSANLEPDLRDDHPIGIAYPVPGDGYKDISAAEVKVVNNRVECTSCHDPHDDDLGRFLRVTITNSTLCTTCHDK